jgi:hypothetical protein
MKKWIPIIGMFTNDAAVLERNSTESFVMCFYHGCFIAIIVCKILM